MNRLFKGMLATTCLAVAALSAGCATTIKPSANVNPPPTEAFSAYARIRIMPAAFQTGVKGNPVVLEKLNENIQRDLESTLPEWNGRQENGRILTVEPVVEEVSFKAGANRILLGPLAGSSGVLMRFIIKDNEGRLLGTPQFFQRAGAMTAGWTFGVHDNRMLTRVANLSTQYLIANYARAVGGPTGGDDPAVKTK